MKDLSQITNIELVSIIVEIQKRHSLRDDNLNAYIRRHYSDVYNEISSRTFGLNAFKRLKKVNGIVKEIDVSIFERIYCLEHSLSERPLCRHCHEKTVCGFNVQTRTYRQWCSARCQASDPVCIAESKHTRADRYGDENYNGIDKARLTRYENNGGSWHAEDFGEKVKAGKVANGHDENWVNSEKAKETMERLISDNPNYWKDRDNKIKQTKVANGHNENWNNRDKFRDTLSVKTDSEKQATKDLRKATCNEIYGCDFPMQNGDCRIRQKHTCQSRYGVDCTLNIEGVHEKARVACRTASWNDYVKKQSDVIPEFTFDDYVAGDSSTKFRWRCAKCGKSFYSAWSNGYTCDCPECSPKAGRKMQTEILEYVMSLGVSDAVMDNRSVLGGRELDIYSESRKAAIELDGLFWHTAEGFVIDRCSGRTTGTKHTRYHLEKTDQCIKAGISLIHIMDDEWIHDKKLCKAIIRRVFRAARPIIPDSMKKIDKHSALPFISKYSFEKICNASVYYGLYVRDKLVSVMAAGKSRGKVVSEWQIMNYSTVNAFDVVRGFGKLFSLFVSDVNPDSVSMYVDRRFCLGETVAESMDFVRNTNPDYYWVNSVSTKKYSRGSFDVRGIDGYDKAKSPFENMRSAGYRRIFDCGRAVFVKDFRAGGK